MPSGFVGPSQGGLEVIGKLVLKKGTHAFRFIPRPGQASADQLHLLVVQGVGAVDVRPAAFVGRHPGV